MAPCCVWRQLVALDGAHRCPEVLLPGRQLARQAQPRAGRAPPTALAVAAASGWGKAWRMSCRGYPRSRSLVARPRDGVRPPQHRLQLSRPSLRDGAAVQAIPRAAPRTARPSSRGDSGSGAVEVQREPPRVVSTRWVVGRQRPWRPGFSAPLELRALLCEPRRCVLRMGGREWARWKRDGLYKMTRPQ